MLEENLFRLSDSVLKSVDEICALRGGIPRNEAILLAISDELGLIKEVKQGNKIVLESNKCFGKKNRREVLLLSSRAKHQFSALAPK